RRGRGGKTQKRPVPQMGRRRRGVRRRRRILQGRGRRGVGGRRRRGRGGNPASRRQAQTLTALLLDRTRVIINRRRSSRARRFFCARPFTSTSPPSPWRNTSGSCPPRPA